MDPTTDPIVARAQDAMEAVRCTVAFSVERAVTIRRPGDDTCVVIRTTVHRQWLGPAISFRQSVEVPGMVAEITEALTVGSVRGWTRRWSDIAGEDCPVPPWREITAERIITELGDEMLAHPLAELDDLHGRSAVDAGSREVDGIVYDEIESDQRVRLGPDIMGVVRVRYGFDRDIPAHVRIAGRGLANELTVEIEQEVRPVPERSIAAPAPWECEAPGDEAA